MISELLTTDAPFDQFVAEMFLAEVRDLAIATEADEQGRSRLPMELQASATFVQDILDYLLTGVEDVNFDEFTGQVSHNSHTLSSKILS